MKKNIRIKFILFVGVIFFALPFFVFAFSYGHQENFYVDSDYDKLEREKISATIRYVSSQAYFYIEDQWWDGLKVEQRSEINYSLDNLAKEFDEKIYPILTETYGSEWKPGIDGDFKISILFEQMKEGPAGYFRSTDQYRKIQAPSSNEKEMVYLNTLFINKEIMKSYLAHEFTHLITFNQKERRLGKEEDIWLNELRADYSPTLLGYDDPYEGSNLEKRLQEFIRNPSDSLLEWRSQSKDYGVISVFGQYLAEHYGPDILKGSLASPYTGVASLNYALKQNKVEKDFSQIFTDWTIAVFRNDCQLGEEYCYKEEPLSYIRTVPSLIFLPSTQQTNLSLVYVVKEWSAHWYKIIGGTKGLKVEFIGLPDVNFVVPYLINKSGKIESVNFLELNDESRGTIELPYFGENNQSLIILPSVQEKTSGFSDNEPFWRFSLDISSFENHQQEQEQDEGKPIEEMTVEELKAKILEIQQRIIQLQAELQKLKVGQVMCQEIKSNLYYGLVDNSQVRCLQEFLKNQGEDIYPEGLVTGNFLSLTKKAVIRFQERYAQEILAPLDLDKGTGFVGEKTREKINQLLSY